MASGSPQSLTGSGAFSTYRRRVPDLRVSGGGAQACAFCQRFSSDAHQSGLKTTDLGLILKRGPTEGENGVRVLSEVFNERQETARSPDRNV